jgi:hypothetical protein
MAFIFCVRCSVISRPPSDDGTALDQFNISLSRLDKTNSSNIWVGGDFNLGNIDWSIPSFITGKPDAKQHHQLLDIIADHNLHQLFIYVIYGC